MRFYRRLAEALRIERAVIVATVIEAKGSAPRETGAKMFICADGRICDTIGGGAGEAKVIRRAKEILRNDSERIVENSSAKHVVENESTTQLVEIDLSGAPHRATEGICGGRMKVWLERWEGARAISLVEEILSRLESGRDCVLATPLNASDPPYLLPDGEPAPTTNVFVDRLRTPPVLLIVGAGHVGIELARAAERIEFQVVLQDDRSELQNHSRLPDGIKFLAEPFAETIARFSNQQQLYVALLSRAYHLDLEALRLILKRELLCKYVGMIGSERRVRQVFQTLADEGFSAADLSSIHAPIGLKIGALTPAEIAVSIAAELISIRRGDATKILSAL